jgi:hypothetical protein
MQNELKRIINLARITGARLIVLDSENPEEGYAVIGLDDYEKLVEGKLDIRGLTEEELIDRINRDIAIWKSENDSNNSGNLDWPRGREKEEEAKINKTERNDSVENNNIGNIIRIGDMIEKRKREKNGRWSIPVERRRGLEEDTVIEEERQYLEDIIF